LCEKEAVASLEKYFTKFIFPADDVAIIIESDSYDITFLPQIESFHSIDLKSEVSCLNDGRKRVRKVLAPYFASILESSIRSNNVVIIVICASSEVFIGARMTQRVFFLVEPSVPAD
jgi:hypothetical protein